MSLNALTDAEEVAGAFAQFARHFESGGDIVERTIGYLGGSEPATLRWYPELQFWAMTQPERLHNRYWNAFGVDDPHDANMLSISCEINPPFEGIDRRCAGVFVSGDNGILYLAHSGRIGGGLPGNGKTDFVKFYGEDTLDYVTWPDKQIWEYIIIGALHDDELRQQVAAFVHQVARFKRETAKVVKLR